IPPVSGLATGLPQLPSASGLEDPHPPASSLRGLNSRLGPPSLACSTTARSYLVSNRRPIGPTSAPPGSLRLLRRSAMVVVVPSVTVKSLFLRLRLVTPAHRFLRTPPPSGTAYHPLSLPASARGTSGSPPSLGRQRPRAPPWPSGSSVSPGSSALPTPPRAPPHWLPLRRPPPTPWLLPPPSLHRGRHQWLRSCLSASPPSDPSYLLLGSSLRLHLHGLLRSQLWIMPLFSSGESVLLQKPPRLILGISL
ncbi:hypothetical protein M9458_025489, partial [Cirrhinus mrigala]